MPSLSSLPHCDFQPQVLCKAHTTRDVAHMRVSGWVGEGLGVKFVSSYTVVVKSHSRWHDSKC